MTTEELVKVVAENEPEMLQKVAGALGVLEKLDPVEVPLVMEDFQKVADVVEEKCKEAGVDWGKIGANALDIGKKQGVGLAVGLTTSLAAAMSRDLYDAVRKGISRSGNFKRILEANPALRKADQSTLRQSFNTIHRFAPEFTADPLLGGSILSAMVEMPGSQHNLIKDMLAASKTMQDKKNAQFSPFSIPKVDFKDGETDMLKQILTEVKGKKIT